jgi:hypothetical protein
MATKRPIRPGRGEPSERAAKAKSKRPVAEVEVVEETSSGSFESGLAIATTVALVAALVLTDALHGKLGGGIFF